MTDQPTHRPTDDFLDEPLADDLMETPDYALLAILAFRQEWAKLPPLVRASIAADMVHRCAADERHLLGRASAEGAYGMDRRRNVTHSFLRGTREIATLFAALARQADTEATAKGYDTLGLDSVYVVTKEPAR